MDENGTWIFCYDVATHFRDDRSIKGTTFFKRAKALAIVLETLDPSAPDGLQSALQWKQNAPGEILGVG